MNPEQSTPAQEEIRRYQASGHLFHGSPDPAIQEFEPRQAIDVDPSEKFNNSKAVYASPNPATALIFSLIHFPPGTDPSVVRRTWGVDMNLDGPIARMPKVWEPFIRSNTGVLYVLPADTFTFSEYDLQAKSSEPVKPEATVKISFDDYLALGGKVEFSDDM